MANYSYETLLVDKKDSVLTITLNRPERLGEGAVEDILVADLGENPGERFALLLGDLVVLGGVLHADAGGAEGVADAGTALAGGFYCF